MAYTFKVLSADESEVWELPYEKITITEEVNKGVDGNINIPYPSLAKYASLMKTSPDGIIASALRYWRLYRDNTLLFRGVFSHRRISGGKTGATTYQAFFGDMVAYLAKRATNLEEIETNEPSNDIAWTRIDNAQNDGDYGDLGITRGANPTTKSRDRTMRHDKVLDVIVGMSNLKVKDGFDFDIDTQLQFNIYSPEKGMSRPEIIISEFNRLSWTSDRPLTLKLANRVHVLGQGQGAEMVAVTRNDTDQQETWGLLTDVISEKGVGETDELNDRGDQYLIKNSTPTDTFSVKVRDVSPDILTYSLGDTVRLIIEEIGVNTLVRIERRTWEIQPNGQAILTLGFGEKKILDIVEEITEQRRKTGDLERY
jgi:hypothetical protein